jgi:hypothetical protein
MIVQERVTSNGGGKIDIKIGTYSETINKQNLVH